ncbi:MAG: DNA-binding winged helix-turn-helix (wHTH) protein [Glaciecola sp.]|jgi:DNA-binding winged helix-turn-helix (wHTH) protein
MQALVTAYQFSSFTLDLVRKKLLITDSKKELPIGERNFHLLHLLCEASPEAVDKNTLTDKLWPSTKVSDWSLSRLISDTRHILGDDGESQEVIKTARGIGFTIYDVVRHSKIPESHPIKKPSKAKPLLLVCNSLLVAAIIISVASVLLSQHKNAKLLDALNRISQYQDNTYTAFVAQANRRNELVEMIEERLNVKRDQQFEKFFAENYSRMNQQERFVCSQMRAITDTGLMQNNKNIVETLNKHPAIFEHIEQAKALQQHLRFWLNKYESIFKTREDMCLLYVGVEDKLPYPSGVDQKIKEWLAENSQ